MTGNEKEIQWGASILNPAEGQWFTNLCQSFLNANLDRR